MTRLAHALMFLALVVVACGSETNSTSTTAAPSTSEQTVTAPESSSSSVTEETGGAMFAVTEVSFASEMVTITNIGSETGTLSGHSLCQRPSYLSLPDTELAPGESARFSSGSLGGFDPDDGEVGLYSSSNFSSPADIVSYVEWGKSGHGRSSVAIEAGIWPEGGFVVTSPDSISIIAAEPPATTPDGWFIESGDG